MFDDIPTFFRPVCSLLTCFSLANIALLTVSGSSVLAQQHVPVSPNQEGQALLTTLQRDYAPLGQLDYGIARDTLFLRVWRMNGQLEGQYTGFKVDLPDGVDPTTYVFDRGINTEHLYPRSKGADFGNGLADMHHLYPTREGVNADRGSLPFAELPDANTQRWYYLDMQRSSPPTSNIDAYSESTNGAFEPREKMKGDIARAIFYFYSIYRDQAMAADPTFFQGMSSTLCDWHNADPVDADEYERTRKIERYQGNPNPFVLDCTVADRINYCPTRSAACQTVGSKEFELTAEEFQVWPNPVGRQLTLMTDSYPSDLALFDAFGRRVWQLEGSEYSRSGLGGNSGNTSTFVKTYAVPAGIGPGVYTLISRYPNRARRIILTGL